MNNRLFTIGYAGKSLDEFLKCLKKYNINYLLDIRSEPHSKIFSEYDKDRLSAFLSKHNIRYVSYGEFFGARRKENDVYHHTYNIEGVEQEQVFFNKVYGTNSFKNGVKKVLRTMSLGWNICFMCSEKEPVNCHRFWMVAYYFEKALKKDIKTTNIVDYDETKSFDDVVSELKYEQAKNKFYKEHEFEIEGYGLLGFKKHLWISWWAEFYNNKQLAKIEKMHLFANYLIGYVKGEEEHD